LHGVIFEMANNVLVNATDPHRKESILAAVQSMKVNTIGGLIDFSAPVTAKPTPGPGHVHPNVYKSPLLAAQWDKGTKHKYELVAVDNTACPDLPVKRKLVAYDVAQGK
jgi:hypothetical protein